MKMQDLLHSLNIGDRLYCPICGDCEVVALDSNEVYCITVRTPYGGEFDFDHLGRFAPAGDVLLFPVLNAD